MSDDLKARLAALRKTTTVEVEGCGAVRLRAISADTAIRFQMRVRKAAAEAERNGDEPQSASMLCMPWLIARSVIAEDGSLALTEEEACELAPSAIEAITKPILVLNGLSPEAIEEAEGNSGASQPGSSPTGSPKSSDTQT